jgi:threonine aldolase
MGVVDLRSDTLTQPSPAMKRAMFEAELGDDVFGEDPTVNRLQELAAELLGKEAGLFISSGTMGNLLGLLVHVGRGDELIADSEAHVFHGEGGGAAGFANVQIHQVETADGVISPDQLVAAVRPPSREFTRPRTAAVSIENTHNYYHGKAWPLGSLRALAVAARKLGLAIHMDGARLFNAAVATGATPRDIAACADTVTFCLSKGLGCPVGSVFVGTRDQIGEARRWRKMIGGGTRQAGILAAAGIFALNNLIDSLADDHANAKALVQGLAEIPGLRCWPQLVETNIVFVDVLSLPVDQFVHECSGRGVLLRRSGSDRVRMVLYNAITRKDVQDALAVIKGVMANSPAAHSNR